MMVVFLQKNYGLSLDESKYISKVYTNTKDLSCVESLTLYFKHGKKRIYYEVWTQNSLRAIEGLVSCYFDFHKKRLMVVTKNYGVTLTQDSNFATMSYSGAVTRSKFNELICELENV